MKRDEYGCSFCGKNTLSLLYLHFLTRNEIVNINRWWHGHSRYAVAKTPQEQAGNFTQGQLHLQPRGGRHSSCCRGDTATPSLVPALAGPLPVAAVTTRHQSRFCQPCIPWGPRSRLDTPSFSHGLRVHTDSSSLQLEIEPGRHGERTTLGVRRGCGGSVCFVWMH